MTNTSASHDLDALKTECVTTIKMLSVDAVEAAGSGHPGAPMGCAEIAFYLFTEAMQYDPSDPDWINRDRFILSNGHASMLLYSMLHLCGYDLSLEQIKAFRQWESGTPGHPEYGDTPGVEVTTGPLGQGFAHGVGMALAAKMMQARFATDDFSPVDHRVFGIVSDGDLMEGVASEAASLAGCLALGNLIYIYDDNKITIDGATDLAFTEDVEARFRAYGWHTVRADGHDLDSIDAAVREARADESRPSLVLARTHIGHGAPTKQDTAGSHGSPLGDDEVAATKAAAGWPTTPTFHVPAEVRSYFGDRVAEIRKSHDAWQSACAEWRERHPDKALQWEAYWRTPARDELQAQLMTFARESLKEKEATRASCGRVLQHAAELIPNLIGGTADLGGSTKTMLSDGGAVGPGSGATGLESFLGRSIHYGVREHAMGSIVNGMTLYGSFRAITATFLVFADYMRPPMRLAALMNIPSIFVFSHDSIYLGEDGPTHQPIEHLASLRAMPNMTVWRPADQLEMAAIWAWALSNGEGPCSIVTTRQALPALERPDAWDDMEVHRGGYVLTDAEHGDPDLVLIATGSEVHIAVEARETLAASGVRARVVSLPSMDLFRQQDAGYRQSVLPAGVRRVSIEVASPFGWHEMVGENGLVLGIDRFGASAPAEVLAEKFGFTSTKVAARILEWFQGATG